MPAILALRMAFQIYSFLYLTLRSPIDLMKNMKNTLAMIALLLLMASCAKTEQVSYTSHDLVLTAEGPLYDGSNTATANWKINLTELIGEGYTAADLTGARITSIRLTAVNPTSLDLVSDVTFLLAGAGVSMQKIGFLNPVPSGSHHIDLQIADGQKGLEGFFKLEQIALVADLNLTDELEEDLALSAQLKISFDVKSK
jgi:hypothetical protein